MFSKHFMRKILYSFICLVVLSCSSASPESYIPFFNGYWEIDHVRLTDGTEKEYKFNPSIDYFEVNDSTGIRKKVQPKLDGTFTITNNSTNEHLSFKIEDDSLRIYYKTPHATWKETVINADQEKLIIKNQSGNIYYYRPYQKLEL